MNNKKIKVFECFSGYGSQSLALRNIGIDYEIVGISEIDKYAIDAYMSLHDTSPNINFGDVSKIDVNTLPDMDLFTYSFPCQDISVCGKQRGLDENSGTRSSLLWECKKIIETKKPSYLLMENVKNLVSAKHKPNFEKWIKWLENQGYKNYWKILNAKDFGIPQNRERVFMVSILNGTKDFEFPKPIKLEKKIKDILDRNIPQKYFLKKSYSDKFIKNENTKGTSGIIRRGIINKGQDGIIVDINGICPTHTCGHGCVPKILISESPLIIRKLTPDECGRLMGLNNKDLENMNKLGFSDNKKYALYGNSIVIQVLEGILKKLKIYFIFKCN